MAITLEWATRIIAIVCLKNDYTFVKTQVFGTFDNLIA